MSAVTILETATSLRLSQSWRRFVFTRCGCVTMHGTRQRASTSNGQTPDCPARYPRRYPCLCGCILSDATALRLTFEPESKTIDFDTDWLAAHAYDGRDARAKGWVAETTELWDSGLRNHVPMADMTALQTGRSHTADVAG